MKQRVQIDDFDYKFFTALYEMMPPIRYTLLASIEFEMKFDQAYWGNDVYHLVHEKGWL